MLEKEDFNNIMHDKQFQNEADVFFLLKKTIAIGTLQWGAKSIDQCLLIDKDCFESNGVQSMCQYFHMSGISHDDAVDRYIDDNSFGPSKKERAPLFMTKLNSVPWRNTRQSFESALRNSLKRLSVEHCEICVIDYSLHLRPIEFWIEAAAMCKRKGLLRAVGLSSCTVDKIRRAVKAGNKYGVPIILNQVDYSLLNFNSPDTQEMEATCKELGVKICAKSSLCYSLLSDEFCQESLANSKHLRSLNIKVEDIINLRECISKIANSHKTTMIQVVINWYLAHGTVPLIGNYFMSQALDALTCLEWSLTQEEVYELDSLALGGVDSESFMRKKDIFVSLVAFGTKMPPFMLPIFIR